MENQDVFTKMENVAFTPVPTMKCLSHERSGINEKFKPSSEKIIDYEIKPDDKGKIVTIITHVKQKEGETEITAFSNKSVFKFIALPQIEHLKLMAEECVNYLNFDKNEEYIKPLIINGYDAQISTLNFAIIRNRYGTY